MLSRFLRQMLFTLYGIYAVLIFVDPITAQGATYYVATTGNDSNPGTLTQPFKTFKKGVSLLQPGDTLYIRGGLYTEQIDLQGPNKTGTAGNYITIAGFSGETITIRYVDPVELSYGPIKARGNRGYLIFQNLVLDGIVGTKGSGWQIRDGNHHFILRNLEIKNFTFNGLYIAGANGIQVINCVIHDQIPWPDKPGGGGRFYGIYFHDGTNGLIEGNEIYDNPGGGMQIYPGPISNLIVRNNIIHHNNTLAESPVDGILVFQGASTTPVSGVQIYNNLVYLNAVHQPAPGNAGGIRVSNGAIGTKVWNNTVYGNKGYGITVQSGLGGPPINTVVRNNIVFANTSGQILNNGSASALSHNLTTDPKFVKTDAFDFRLQSYSPAIRTGVTLSEVTTDIRGRSRWKDASVITITSGIDGIYDIGAYAEDISDSQSPSAPKNVSVK